MSASGPIPCPTCPWRVDRDASTIPNYNHEKACGLTACVGAEDGFRPIMACHGSSDGNEFACLGYLAREGRRNINVRILVAIDRMPNPDVVLEACERAGVELHPDYASVLHKLSGKCGAL